jgi:hypothetical protein
MRSVQSSEQGSPIPLPYPPLGPTGETHWLAREGVPNSDEGTDAMGIYVYHNNPSTDVSIANYKKSVLFIAPTTYFL